MRTNLIKPYTPLLFFNILLLLFTLLQDLKAQTFQTGTIIDAYTKEPIAGATVYINNSQFFTTSNESGKFQFPFSPGNTITLVVTHVGYQKATADYHASSNHPVIRLSTKTRTMNEVVVKGKIKDTWKKWGQLFEEYFLGRSTPKNTSFIVNPKVLRFRYLNQDDKLIVTASEPVIITNKWLGYTIKYDLDSFVYSFANNYILYTGTSFYAPMEGSHTQKKQWDKHRVVTYLGSQMHFFRSLYRDSTTMAQQGFKLFMFRARKNPERERVDQILFNQQRDNYIQGRNNTESLFLTGNKDTVAYYKEVLQKPLFIFFDSLPILVSKRLSIDSIIKHLSFQKDTLLVSFDARTSYQHLYGLKTYQQLLEEKLLTKTKQPFTILAPFINPKEEYSLLIATREDQISIHKNGYSDPSGLFVLGVMADKKVAGTLPWDYLPATEIK
jgi:hypothetical protein